MGSAASLSCADRPTEQATIVPKSKKPFRKDRQTRRRELLLAFSASLADFSWVRSSLAKPLRFAFKNCVFIIHSLGSAPVTYIPHELTLTYSMTCGIYVVVL